MWSSTLPSEIPPLRGNCSHSKELSITLRHWPPVESTTIKKQPSCHRGGRSRGCRLHISAHCSCGYLCLTMPRLLSWSGDTRRMFARAAGNRAGWAAGSQQQRREVAAPLSRHALLPFSLKQGPRNTQTRQKTNTHAPKPLLRQVLLIISQAQVRGVEHTHSRAELGCGPRVRRPSLSVRQH